MRVSPRPVTVPCSSTQYATLKTDADVIIAPIPSLASNDMFGRYKTIYNKYKAMTITINIQPHQNSSFMYNVQGSGDPLKYVIYRVSPDTIGTHTNPTTFREAMSMPGAIAYNLTQAARRTRKARMGVVNNYVNNSSFTTTNVVPVRHSTYTPWMSTSMEEADDPFLYGWSVWFPQVVADTVPTFEIINVVNVRFTSAIYIFG